MMSNNCNLNCNKYMIANQTNDDMKACDQQQQQQQQQQSHFLTHYNTISDNANCVLNFNNYMCPSQQQQSMDSGGCSLAQNQFITNNNYSTSQIGHEIAEKAAKKEKHQIAHRQIEKKRRDRMNKQLGRLKELLPENLIKKAKARVEKVEIVEMAIEYLTKLNAQQTKTDSTSTSTTSLVEAQTDLLNKKSYKQGVEDGMKALLKLFKEFSKTETNILSSVAQLAKKLTTDVIETIDDKEEEHLDLDSSVTNLLKSRYKFAKKLQSSEVTPPASTSNDSTCQTNAFPATPNFMRKGSSSVMFSLSSTSSTSSLSNNGDTSGHSEEMEGCNEWSRGGDCGGESSSGDSSGIVKYLNLDNQTVVTKYKREMCSRFQASQSSSSSKHIGSASGSCCSSSIMTNHHHLHNKRKLDKKKKKKKKSNKKRLLM